MFSVKWEEPDEAEEHADPEHDEVKTVRLPTPPPAIPPSESEDNTDSEDEYIAEPEKYKRKGSSSAKVRSCYPIQYRFLTPRRFRTSSVSVVAEFPAPASRTTSAKVLIIENLPTSLARLKNHQLGRRLSSQVRVSSERRRAQRSLQFQNAGDPAMPQPKRIQQESTVLESFTSCFVRFF